MMKYLFACLSIGVISIQAVPQQLTYQGKLTDVDGIGINDTLNMVIRIYDLETGGTALWYRTVYNVEILHGLFTVELSSVDLPFDEQYWLEITIDGDVLSPRNRLTSSAYSFRAAIADSLAGGDHVIATRDTMIAHWDSLRNIPEGFADGIDNEGGDDGDWTLSGLNMYSAVSGNIGVGTTDPGTNKLSVITAGSNNAGYFKGESAYSYLAYRSGVNDYGIYTVSPSTSTANNYGIRTSATGAATANYGIYASASGIAINWAGYFDSGNVYIDNNLGIGTTFPTHKLTVSSTEDDNTLRLMGPDGTAGYGARLNFGDGDQVYIEEVMNDDLLIYTTDLLLSIGGSLGSDGQVLTSNGSEAHWEDFSDGDWTVSGSNMYSAVSGNIGIGTMYPGSYKLNVEGDETNTAGVFSGEGSATALAGQTGVEGFAIDASAYSNSTLYNYGILTQAIGTSTMNVGIMASAQDATTNWAGYFGAGNVYIENSLGIGTTDPSYYKLNVECEGSNTAGRFSGESAYTLLANRASVTDYAVDAYAFSTSTAYNIGLRARAYGSGTTNYGIMASAGDAATNWAGYFGAGNVYIENQLSVGSAALLYHKLSVTGSGTGVNGTTGYFANTTGTQGIALMAHNTSTSSTTEALIVNKENGTGNIVRFDQGDPWNIRFAFTLDGNGRCDGSWTGGGADFAEFFELEDHSAQYEPGDVVLLSEKGYYVETGAEPYSERILGVYTTNPVVVGGATAEADPQNSIPVGLIGVCPTKVCAENGPVETGDYLTASSTPGVAMKATRPCMVIGRAMDSFSGDGTGKINVFVNAGWHDNGDVYQKLETENAELRRRIEQLELMIMGD